MMRRPNHQLSNPTRQGNSALMLMIFLGILTATLSFFAYDQNTRAREAMEGGEGAVSSRDSLAKLASEVRELKQTIATNEKNEERLSSAKQRLGLKLAALGGYAHNGNLIAYAVDARYMKGSLDYAQNVGTMMEMWNRAYNSESMQKYPALKELEKKYDKELQNTTRRIDDADDRFIELKDKLDFELDRLAREKRNIDDKRKRVESTLKTSIIQKEQQIRKLLALELNWLTEIQADGEILEVDLNRRYLVINLGSRDDVTPGLRLEVFSRSKGSYQSKGLIEVTEIQETIATCRIIEEPQRAADKMVPGDSIGNPIYDKARQRTFVLVGQFRSHNPSDIKRFLIRSGAKVMDEIGPGVDFLVTGSLDSDKDAEDLARQYHIIGMHEATLMRYLDNTFNRE